MIDKWLKESINSVVWVPKEGVFRLDITLVILLATDLKVTNSWVVVEKSKEAFLTLLYKVLA